MRCAQAVFAAVNSCVAASVAMVGWTIMEWVIYMYIYNILCMERETERQTIRERDIYIYRGGGVRAREGRVRERVRER